jgi:hypothetical protein
MREKCKCTGHIEFSTVLQMFGSYFHNDTKFLLKTCHLSVNLNFDLDT